MGIGMKRILTAIVTAAALFAGLGSATADQEFNPIQQLFGLGNNYSGGGAGPVRHATESAIAAHGRDGV